MGEYLIDNTSYGDPQSEHYSNIFNELGTETYNLPSSYKLLWNQYGGNFPKLKFVNSDSNNKYMDYSCCEILATFNLLSIAGKFDYKDNMGNITNDINKYFKLSAEFEINDLMFGQIIPTGRFGSKPSGIGNCLEAYDVNFKYYNWIDEDIDDTLKNSSCFSIISVFSTPNIHTYNVFYDSSKNSYVAINCGSGNLYGWEFSSIYESCRGNLLIGAYILL